MNKYAAFQAIELLRQFAATEVQTHGPLYRAYQLRIINRAAKSILVALNRSHT